MHSVFKMPKLAGERETSMWPWALTSQMSQQSVLFGCTHSEEEEERAIQDVTILN